MVATATNTAASEREVSTPTTAAESGAEPAVVVALDDVSKHFGEIRAVDDASATIRSGQIVGLIGPNGSGKTTLLRLLAGLATPTAGSVAILGVAPTVSSIRRHVGIVGARFPVARRRSGAEVLEHLAALRQLPDVGRGRELAERLDLDLRRRADELSRGNLQKLALVQALMHDPKVLLLDEPTVGLDPVAQRTLNELLADERERGTTVIMSSHVLSAVHTIATHVLAIRDGRIIIDGPIGPVLNSTGRRVTARVHAGDIDRVAALLADSQRTEESGPAQWTVSGHYHGDPNDLVRQLARCELMDLTIANPQLDDLVDDVYRNDDRSPT